MSEEYFQAIETPKQLVKLALNFLFGTIKEWPWHAGNVDKETIPLLDNLRFINFCGLISVEGQPPNCTYNERIKDKYLDTEQKSYIKFFLPKKYFKEFKAYLDAKEKTIVYVIVSSAHKIIYETVPKGQYIVTRSKYRGEKEWDNETLIPTDHFDGGENFEVTRSYKKLYKLLTDNYYMVDMNRLIYCKGSVEDILLDFLKCMIKSNKLDPNFYDVENYETYKRKLVCDGDKCYFR